MFCHGTDSYLFDRIDGVGYENVSSLVPSAFRSQNGATCSNVRFVSYSARFFLPLLLGPTMICAAQQSPAPDNAVTRAIDPEIAATIATIKAFDNHAHPVLPPTADKTDREFDALPVDNMEPETDIVAWRPDNPQLLDAWRALWGFEAKSLPLDAEGMKQLDAARARVKSQQGTHFDEWVLDQAGIGT